MISPRQQRVFSFIRGYIESNQEAPTIAEICNRFGYRSWSTVHRILVILQNEGLIERSRKARGITIVA